MAHNTNLIESIADKKVRDIELLEYHKYKKHFELAVTFLKKEKILMYGGNAINDLMPKRLKFYEEMSLPDIDIFAVNGKKLAARIVKKFQDRGFQYCGFKEALHENTYKVFIEGLQILDITDISSSIYKKLSTGRIKGDHGIYIANPEFLRMTLHLLMAHPFDAYRWPKVYKRLVHFYKQFPMKKCVTMQSLDTSYHIDERLVELFNGWVHKNGYVFFGGPEVMRYLALPYSDERRDIFVWDNDIVKVAQDFMLTIPDHIRRDLDLGISKLVKDDTLFVSDHVFITSRGRKLFGIYMTDYCTSYVNIGGFKIASFHTLCETYMSMSFVDSSERINCIIHNLGAMQTALIKKPSKKKILDQFVLECYGPFETQATLRRKQIDRIMKRQEMKF
jgi:hypothetical protein